MGRRNFHRRFVALNRDQALVHRHGIPYLDQQFDNGHFIEVANVGHLNINICHDCPWP